MSKTKPGAYAMPSPRILCGLALVLFASVSTAQPIDRAGDLPTEAAARATIKTMMVASPYRISDGALAGKIRYRLSLADGAALALPETGEQHVTRDGDVLIATICKERCGSEASPTSEALRAYQHANPWVQSDDYVVRDFARSVAASGSVNARMRRLVRAVQQRMTGPIEYRRYETAREAFDGQSGDCTEFAILLAAAARARGIPTRVVGGLAYSSRFLGGQHVFGPHMWVQAWDGARWVSYDAGLGDFDAGHIAIALGDGTPASMAGMDSIIRRLRIVDAVELIPRSAKPVR